MVASQATPADDPGKAAFDHPSSGQRLKPWRKEGIPLDLGTLGNEQTTLGNLQTPHNRDGPAQVQLEPGDQVAGIVAIAPQELDGGKDLLHGLK